MLNTCLSMQHVEEVYEEYLHSRKSEDDGLSDVYSAIEHHLSCVRHEEKFGFSKVCEVFNDSVKDGDKRMPPAWKAVAKYADNIISQPWRPEYRTLKLFNGYIKHKISPYIKNIGKLFLLMGYKDVGCDTYILEEPVKMELLILASLDCLIASIECRIMLDIQKKVKSRHVPWHEVVQTRALGIGSMQDTVMMLEGSHRPPMHSYYPYMPTLYPSRGLQIDYPHVPYWPYPQVLHSHQMYPDLFPIRHTSIRPESQMSYENDPKHLPRTIPHRRKDRIDHSLPRVHQAPPKDICQPVTHDEHIEASLAMISREEPRKPLKDQVDGEDWNYVYSGLSHQGYCKDWGLEHPVEKKGSRSKILDEQLSRSKDDTPSLCGKKSLLEVDKTSRHSDSSGNAGKKEEGISERTRDAVEESSAEHVVVKKSSWECNSCTFHNDQHALICSMCFKSRTKGKESIPLGGRECPHCTLINKKEARKCEVCNKDLDGSPTYV